MRPEPTLHLLLADAAANPVLDGISIARTAPARLAAPMTGTLLDRGGSPNDLLRQRWGLVVAADRRGDALVAALGALIAHRKQQQNGEPIVLRFDNTDPARWIQDVYVKVPVVDRPRYLAIAGGLDQVSLELQRALSVTAFVGRICFETEQQYRDYAEKVIAHEADVSADVQLKFFCADDRSGATRLADRELVTPCHGEALTAFERGLIPKPPERIASSGTALREAARSPRTLLFSAAHGLGKPTWTDEARRIAQGSMVVAPNDVLLGDELASTAFLPRGIWVMFACFGAGTPATSSYTHWIGQLVDPTERDEVTARTIATLADGAGFVSGPAMAALANANGPTALIGHMDLAWAASFNDGTGSRTAHFSEALALIAGGSRVGIALGVILEASRQAAHAITLAYNDSEAAKQANQADPVDRSRLLMDWMVYQDLQNFVVLGDPAVKL